MADQFAAEGFDAENYKNSRPWYNAQVYDVALNLAGLHQPLFHPLNVVDLGSGPGFGTLDILRYLPDGSKITGVEPSSPMYRVAKKLQEESGNPNVSFVRESAEDLSSFADSSVDLIVSFQAAHWFNIEKVYTAAARVLKPGGALVLCAYGNLIVPTSKDLEVKLHNLLFSSDYLGDYWDKGRRKLVDELYKDIPFPTSAPWDSSSFKRAFFGPFEDGLTLPSDAAPIFATLTNAFDYDSSYPNLLKRTMSLAQLKAYVNSISATNKWRRENPDLHKEGVAKGKDSFDFFVGDAVDEIIRKDGLSPDAIPTEYALGYLAARVAK